MIEANMFLFGFSHSLRPSQHSQSHRTLSRQPLISTQCVYVDVIIILVSCPDHTHSLRTRARSQTLIKGAWFTLNSFCTKKLKHEMSWSLPTSPGATLSGRLNADNIKQLSSLILRSDRPGPNNALIGPILELVGDTAHCIL